MDTPRQIVRGLVAGRGSGTLAVPLALHTAARIAERDAEDFLYDPTQLANALRDLIDAVEPDGVPVTSPDVLLADCPNVERMLASDQLVTAVEATRRLRSSYGDRIVLVAPLPGPARLATELGLTPTQAQTALLGLGKEFLAAGVDVLLVVDADQLPGVALPTLANVARFHQALALTAPTAQYGLVSVGVAALDEIPTSTGLTVTDNELARDTDIEALRDWVDSVRTAVG